MPIDFAKIAALYRRPVMMRAKTMGEALARLGNWLNVRLRSVSATERATRAYPVIWFYNGAVTVWIDRSQHRQLTPNEVAPSLGESFHEGGRRFMSGLRRVGDSIEEELALPRLLGTFSEMFETIVASMDRFAEPTPAMFDIRTPRRASDLFGEGALLFRAFTSSLDQINHLAGMARQPAAQVAQSSGARVSQTVSASQPIAPATMLAAQSQSGAVSGLQPSDIMRGMVGAVLLVPIASRLIVSTLNSAILAGKLALTRRAQGIEEMVFGLRVAIIDFFYTFLGGFGPAAFDFLLALQFIVMVNVNFYFGFASFYLNEVFLGLRSFATHLSNFLRFFTILAEAVRGVLEAILNFDLMPIFLGALGIPGAVLSLIPGIPSLTIDDLISMLLGFGRVAAREVISSFLLSLELNPVIQALGAFTSIRSRIRALRALLRMTLTARPFIAETALPTTLAPFPDIYSAFFGPGAPNLRGALASAGTVLQSDIGNLFTSASDFLLATSRAMSRTAERAAQLESPERFASIRESAGRMSSQLFDPISAELRQRMSERSDGLARGFERFVAGGAFDIIAGAIPLYVGQMMHYWLDHTEEEISRPAPTSPHILARRAGLRRVRFPRLIIRAPGRQLDADLVTQISARFKEAIEGAYTRGLAQAATAH
jgi:hypothetical protein